MTSVALRIDPVTVLGGDSSKLSGREGGAEGICVLFTLIGLEKSPSIAQVAETDDKRKTDPALSSNSHKPKIKAGMFEKSCSGGFSETKLYSCRVPKVLERFLLVIPTWLLLLPFFLLQAGCSMTDALSKNVAVVIEEPADVGKITQKEQELSLSRIDGDKLPAGVERVAGVPVQILPEYRIGAGDVLEIVYHIEYQRVEEEYKLEVQDRLTISFPFQPQFSTSVLIRPDGRISLPLVGEVVAAAETPASLTNKLKQLYSKYIISPQLTVSVQEFSVKIAELKRAITTASRGQSKIAPVTPDGRIALPIIGNIQAAGLTVSQLEKIINQKYGAYVHTLHTTLILNEVHNAKCYVLGEVKNPGAYEVTHMSSLLNAITSAGGHLSSGNLDQVLIFRSDGLREPVVYLVNVRKMLDEGKVFAGLSLRPADIVYVPKGSVDRLNDVIAKIFTKGVYGVIPFQVNYGINYNTNNN